MERVLTDNDKAYTAHVFQTVATRAHIRLLKTRPYRPQTQWLSEGLNAVSTRGTSGTLDATVVRPAHASRSRA